MRYSKFSAVLFVVTMSASSLVSAMGLGAAQVRSGLGQPLNLIIPVSGDAAEDLSANCFALAQMNSTDDSLPMLQKAKLTLKDAEGAPYLLLTTQSAINDPVLVFAVEMRCPGTVRRKYTVLLDVAPSNTPSAANPADTVSPAVVPATVPLKPSVSNQHGSARHVHASKLHRPSVAHSVVRAETVSAAGQPAPNLSLHMSTGLAWLPGQHPLSAEQLSTLKRMQGMLSIDGGGQTAEIDHLRDDITATRQQLAQAKQALVLLKAQLTKTAIAQAQQAQPVIVKPVSWWLSGWLWSGLALLVLVVGYMVDRRRKLPNLMLTATDNQTAAGQIKLGAIAAVDPATNDLWSTDTPAAPSPQQHPDIEFAVDDLPGRNMLTQASPRNNVVQTEALSVSNLMRVTEEAEVFLGLGYTDRAIAVLLEDIAANPRNHPAVWFMLLGIYREQGDRVSFDQTLAGFRQRFNLMPPSWETIQHLEQEGEGVLAMPHIQAKIVSLWPGHECHDYLSELLYDDRQGSRQGFSLDVYRDIIWLKEILDILSKPETSIAEEVAADDSLDWDL
ncbi:MAG: hypothetical protein P4L77_10330 [Sulfuriferula sp.]|nr:hypothetical protein [Sulfuriferula sp.]